MFGFKERRRRRELRRQLLLKLYLLSFRIEDAQAQGDEERLEGIQGLVGAIHRELAKLDEQ